MILLPVIIPHHISKGKSLAPHLFSDISAEQKKKKEEEEPKGKNPGSGIKTYNIIIIIATIC